MTNKVKEKTNLSNVMQETHLHMDSECLKQSDGER